MRAGKTLFLKGNSVYLEGAKFSCAGFFLVLGLLVGVAFFAVLVLGFGCFSVLGCFVRLIVATIGRSGLQQQQQQQLFYAVDLSRFFKRSILHGF